ncbi:MULTISPECIES: YjcZ family sporulation protein [Metabacillus]|nr:MULTISPECIES: YjcZ family sporulation protein [Metabacillus]
MYGYDCGCSYPSYPVHCGGGLGSSFVLIVVLFILLIIVGSAYIC